MLGDQKNTNKILRTDTSELMILFSTANSLNSYATATAAFEWKMNRRPTTKPPEET